MQRWLSGLATFLLVVAIVGSGSVSAYDKASTVYMVGNSHIDAAWRWRTPSAVKACRNTFHTMLLLLERNPDYRFTQPSALYYQWMQEYYPELFARIREKVKEGTWEIAGGQVIEPDFNLSSGESLVRQFLYGKRYFRAAFGVDVRTAFAPDAFGFPHSLPQILKRSGIDQIVLQKLNWNDTNRFPHELFTWEGLDGSRVLAYKTRYDYQADIDEAKILHSLRQPHQLGQKNSLYLYGVGDHGGGPTQRNIEEIRALDVRRRTPAVKMRRLDEYFAGLDPRADLPVWDDELYLEAHRGVYTSQAAMKKYNREGEILAEEAEKFASLAAWLGAASYPAEPIGAAWARINLNQFHDILPGTSIRRVHLDAWDDAETALNLLRSARDHALAGIMTRLDTVGPGVPLVVFNPLSWARTSPVEAEIELSADTPAVKLFGPDGRELPVQIIGRRTGSRPAMRIVFVAWNVPSLGYGVYWVVPVAASSPGIVMQAGAHVLENDALRAEIDPVTGNLRRVYDKIAAREVLAGGEGNVLQVFRDDPRLWDAWELDRRQMARPLAELKGPVRVDLVEAGPVRTVYRVTRAWSGSSIQQDLMLYAALGRLEIRTVVDWRESHRCLKVSVPVNVEAGRAVYEIPYGVSERPTGRNDPFGAARFEVPGQKWADLSGEHYGVAVLNNAKYGWDIGGNRIRLTLLRASEWPDPAADRGRHEFTYALYPHQGDWRAGNMVRQGYDLNYPLLARQAEAHPGDLPANFSFIGVDQPNVVVSVVKQAEDAGTDDTIVRLYETQGRARTEAALDFAGEIQVAREVNLLEDDAGEAAAAGRRLTVQLGAYEIRTFRFKLARPYFRDRRPIAVRLDLRDFFNRDGVSANSDRRDGDLDGRGATFAAELWPRELLSRDVPFRLGDPSPGVRNVLDCAGQRLPLPRGVYGAVYLLGFAAGGADWEKGQAVVGYADDSSARVDLAFRDWVATVGGWGILPIPDAIARVMTHRHRRNGDDLTRDNHLYLYRIPLDSGKAARDLILPVNQRMKIVAVTITDR